MPESTTLDTAGERRKVYRLTFWHDTPDGVVERFAQDRGLAVCDTRRGRLGVVGPKTSLLKFLAQMPKQAQILMRALAPHPKPEQFQDMPCFRVPEPPPVVPGTRRALADIIKDGPKVRGELCSPDPLPTVPVQGNTPDLSGQRFGRLSIVGYAGDRGKWVVRCDCGHYTIRVGRTLTEGRGPDCCPACSWDEYLASLADEGGAQP